MSGTEKTNAGARTLADLKNLAVTSAAAAETPVREPKRDAQHFAHRVSNEERQWQRQRKRIGEHDRKRKRVLQLLIVADCDRIAQRVAEPEWLEEFVTDSQRDAEWEQECVGDSERERKQLCKQERQ